MSTRRVSDSPIQAPKLEKPTPKKALSEPKKTLKKQTDELSKGAGRALRMKAESQLGAGPFSARASVATEGMRLGPGGVLMARSSPSSSGTEKLSGKAREDFFESINLNAHYGFGGLPVDLLKEYSPIEKAAYIAAVVNDGELGIGYLFETIGTSVEGAKVVSEALGEAYRRGELTTAQLVTMADVMGEDGPRMLVQALSLDPANSVAGGPLEMVGKALQARAGGDPTSSDAFAAAMAFTATPELMQRNLTTPNARLLAFDALNLGRPDAYAFQSEEVNALFETQAHAQTLAMFAAHGPELLELTANDQNESRDYRAMTAFFTNEAFSPRAHELVPGIDDLVKGTLDKYTEQVLTRIASGKYDSVSQAQQLGTVFGFLDAGGLAAVDNYKKSELEKFDFNALYKDLALGLLSTAVGAATAGTGAIATSIIGSVVTNAAGQAIGSPEAAKYRDELEKKLGLEDITPGSDSLRELQQAYAAAAGNLSSDEERNLAILSGAFADGFGYVEPELAD